MELKDIVGAGELTVTSVVFDKVVEHALGNILVAIISRVVFVVIDEEVKVISPPVPILEIPLFDPAPTSYN